MSDKFDDAVPNDGAPGSTDNLPTSSAVAPDTGDADPEALLERTIGWYKASRDHRHDWRAEASEMFDIAAGRQWDEEALEILRDQSRPAITLNRIDPFIDAVCGMEINTRQETTFKPRKVQNTGETDVLSEAAKWVRDECDAEDEESASFKDLIISGEGWTQTRMSYDDDPDGIPVIDRVDPMEMYPDPSAQKDNYADARYILRVKDIDLDAAQSLFPDASEWDLHAQWAEDTADEASNPHNARAAPFYRIDQSGEIDRGAQRVRLVEAEWWDYKPAYRVLDPQTGRWLRVDKDRMTMLALAARMQGLPPYRTIEDRTKVYKKGIFGNILLKLVDGADEGGFSYKAMTGKRDRNKGCWYGMVRAMKDPQQWANKFFSQALHIMNTNAKGGLIAEADAFEDIEEARDTWAEADSITLLAPGGISKIQPKNPPAFPPQLNAMLEYAVAAIPQVNGMNLEMMGQSSGNGQQAGVVEAGRRMQGMNILAGFFNAKRRYQKEQGRLLLWMIRTFISDGRLIRVGGQENAQYVPLIHVPGTVEYDVIVDDAPTSPNMKERVWGALMQMMPMLRGMPIPPQFYINALKYAPIPASFVTESTQILSAPPPPNQGMQSKQAVDQATAQLKQAQAAKLQAEAQSMPQRMQLEAQETGASIDLKQAQAVNQYQNAGLATNQAMQDAHQAAHDRAMDLVQHVHQSAKDAFAAGQPQAAPPQPGSAPVGF